MKPENFYFAVFRDFYRRYWYFFVTFLIIVLAAVGSYAYVNIILKKPVHQAAKPKLNITIYKNNVTVPSVQQGIFCPLDGDLVTSLPDHNALAVPIDNSPEARPQSGLKDADMVMEFPVEGGITRLLAFYYHSDVARIGPVRSARPYLVDKAFEYGATLVHAGQSPQAVTEYKKTKIEHVDALVNPNGFWRENNRKAPHNLYTSTTNIWNKLNKEKKSVKRAINSFDFKDNVLLNGQTSPKVTIFYPFSEVTYDYQPSDKNYLRFIGDKAHIDGDSYLPLQIKNVVIQFVDTKVLDGEGRLALDLQTKGRAIVASQGKTSDGTWQRSSDGLTHYYDNKGKEVTLPHGQTWVEIVPKNMEIDY